jgi:hypothetical protein
VNVANAVPREASLLSVPVQAAALFSWNYAGNDGSARTPALYEKAKKSFWNAATDLPWHIAVDQEEIARADASRHSGLDSPQLAGTVFSRWSERHWAEFAIESQNWTLSQFLHGEQGALLVAARLVETSPSLDAKIYAGIQAADEARHVEAFSRYLTTKLSGCYPVNAHLRSFMVDLLSDSRWDITYLGMQVMIEGLALAAFGLLYQATSEPLLRTLLKFVRADEARHVAFGVSELHTVYPQLSTAELAERQEFALDAAIRLRDRLLRQEVWERLGVPGAQGTAVLRSSPAHRAFQTSIFAKVINNCERLGLLDYRNGWLREKFTANGF